MKTSCEMILNVDLPDEGFCELCGTRVKYWAGFGLPTFEGTIDQFSEEYPRIFEQLRKSKAVRSAKEF